ncbi:hypothetical protein [Ruicaihuangia caeni]|uniref:CTP synthetase n=1 Tax=Ruicaihuangia caeni TaxID=3042517 RepID=A0AAW6T385_9MICO|nr:hypothetical protein [Klugiella sp. YN-L-19]MDI2097904.1 hypothetical protein [Klugiella sp. YN-L-19]
MNHSRLKSLALISGILASTGIALTLGGVVCVIIAAVQGSLPWVIGGAAALVIGVGSYVGAQRLAFSVTRSRRQAQADAR